MTEIGAQTGPEQFAGTSKGRLNPSGTTLPLKSAGGEPLLAATGSYRVVIDSGGGNTGGGNPVGTCPGTSSNTGFYTVTKTLAYTQTAANDVNPSAEAAAAFAVFVQGPPAGGGSRRRGGGFAETVTNASITLPGGQTQDLANQAGRLSFLGLPATESALEASYPPGTYTMRLGLPNNSYAAFVFSTSSKPSSSASRRSRR